MRKDQKTYGKPSNSYEKRLENLWLTIKFLSREDEEKPRRNHQIPMREDSKMNGKPWDS